MVVADGISSTEGGGHASQVAVETIKSVLMEPHDVHETTSDRMAQAIALANQEILFQARQNPAWSRMGTTVVLALIVHNRLYVMGLGDSRAYLIRQQEVFRLTTDHTWAQYAQDAGNGSVASMVRHPHRSRLVRYLGNPNGFHVERGIVSPESKEKEEYITVQDGDAVLLCSDGLYKLVSEPEFNQAIHANPDASDRVVSSLIALARQKGESDDITALLLKVPTLNLAAQTEPLSDVPTAERKPSRTVRFVLALAVALALLIFQLNYRQDGAVDTSIQTIREFPTVSARASLGIKPTPTIMLTATVTSTGTPTPPPTIELIFGNGTIPLPSTMVSPTRVLPTVALPTPAGADD